MMKQIVGTVSGVVSGGIVMALITGVASLFADGTFETSVTWIVLGLALGLAAAVAGGWTAALVGGKTRAVLVLAGLVLVLGLIGAGSGRPSATPTWLRFVTPLLSTVGVLIGGRRRLNF